MKIIRLIAAATAALGLLASCQQQEVENLTNQEELVPVSLTASFSTAETKVSYTETTTDGIKLQPAWNVNDKVIGFDGENNTYTFTVSEIDGSGVATLDGACPSSCTLHLIYLCDTLATSIKNGTLAVSYDNQAGTVGSNNVYTMPAVMLADGEVSYGSGDFRFSNAGAVIGVKAVKGVPNGSTVSKITVSGENLSAATIALDGSGLKLTATEKADDSISTAALSGVTVTDDDGTLSKLVLIAVPADAKVGKVTAAAGDKTYSFKLASAATLAAGRYSYISGSQTFTDDRIPVSGITLDPTSKTIDVGESFTITATVSPSDATDKTVTWTSSDPTVATVDENGQVTAVGAGTATITATVGGQTATFTVTVAPAVGYVEIEAKYDGTNVTTLKWATQNLSISESGSKSWKGRTNGNTSAVKVPGTDEDVKVGDYFQWAADENYCVDASVDDKGLLIYKSFTNMGCGDGSDAFTFKSGKSFAAGKAPHYSGSAYTKYTSGSVNLEESDDVAHIILGGDWRMPTSAEFKAMREATYWAWDATYEGYYVFKPGQGTSGAANGRGTLSTTTDDKTKALLFFPAAGLGDPDGFYTVGSYGHYWSSSLHSGDTSNAYFLSFSGSGVYPQANDRRYYGRSVRPVSY